MIEHYAVRPDELEDLCLASFVSNYTYSRRKGGTAESENVSDGENEDNDVNDENEQTENSRRAKRYALKDKSGFVSERKQPKVIRYCRFSIEKDPDNFYREMCFLFMPWRDENTEIANKNCVELYSANERVIKSNYKVYNAAELNWEDLINEIERNRAESEEEQVNGSSTQQNPEENEDYVNVYEFDDNVVAPSISREIGEEVISSISVTKYVIPDMLSDEEYLKRCDMLNVGQKDYLMHFISCFKKINAQPIYHFICGGAGVGKSKLIEAIYQSAIKIIRKDPGPVQKTDVLLIAYTGMAAHNIGGMTAHAAFHLVTTKGDTSSSLKPDVLNTLRSDLLGLKLIIIDEISMLSAELLDQISQRLKQIFQSPLEFGGRSVIAVGDFSQLKPIGGSMVFFPKQHRNQNSLTQLIDGNPQWDHFEMYELTKIMRQRDDQTFAEALNRIAAGTTNSTDVELFKSRCYTETTLPVEANGAIRIMATNKEVDEYNAARIRLIKTTASSQNIGNSIVSIVHIAEDKFSGQLTTSQRNQAKHLINKLDKRDTQNLITNLEIVVGIRYMVSTNVDVADGLFNGATGTVTFIEISDRKVKAVYVKFEDSLIGKKARESRKAIMDANNLPDNWTPISKTKRSFNVLKKGTVQVNK